MNPKPIKYSNIKEFHHVWKTSADNIGSGKSPGIDNVQATVFKNNLSANINEIRAELISGNYQFSALKAVFLEKGNGKERVICIPTVRDRLVQRLITYHMCGKYNPKKRAFVDLLKVRNKVNYDIKESGGTKKALDTLLKLREKHQWVLKTDICAFFDNIDREILFTKIAKSLGKNSSLMPLIEQIIYTEIHNNQWHNQYVRLKACGLEKKMGIRQGMPMSPLLAGFFLRDFDKKLKRKKINVIRYADDLAILCDSEQECSDIHRFIVDELNQLKLQIPLLSTGAKTSIYQPTEEFTFLGFGIKKIKNKYVRTIPKNSRHNIFTNQKKYSKLKYCMENHKTYGEVLSLLERKKIGYKNSYKGAINLDQFIRQYEQNHNKITLKIITQIIPQETLKDISVKKKKFLGISN